MGNMQMLMHNVTMVIPSVTFNGESTFRAMQREKATTLYGTAPIRSLPLQVLYVYCTH